MKKKLSYEILIVIACFLIMGGAVGIAWNGNSLFVKPICADTGYARSQVIILTSMLSGVNIGMSLLSSSLYKRFKPATLLKIMSLLLPVFYCGISFCHALWQFYLVQFCVAVTLFLSSTIPLSMILGNWFRKSYGTAVGIAFMGSGVFGMIFNSLIGQWLQIYGWRVSYRILSVCLAVLTIPPALLIIRNAPEDIGLKPYGADEVSAETSEEPAVWGPMFKDVVKTPTFWVICLAILFSGIAMAAQIQTVSPRLTDLGYSVTMSSNIAALGLGSLAIGKVLLGWFFDKLSAMKATLIAIFLCIIALTGELFASFLPFVALIIFGEGISSAFGSVGLPVLSRYVYGTRDYKSIYSKFVAFSSIGGMVGPLMMNAMYDTLGSYDLALIVNIILAALSLFFIWWALHRPQAEQN